MDACLSCRRFMQAEPSSVPLRHQHRRAQNASPTSKLRRRVIQNLIRRSVLTLFSADDGAEQSVSQLTVLFRSCSGLGPENGLSDPDRGTLVSPVAGALTTLSKVPRDPQKRRALDAPRRAPYSPWGGTPTVNGRHPSWLRATLDRHAGDGYPACQPVVGRVPGLARPGASPRPPAAA